MSVSLHRRPAVLVALLLSVALAAAPRVAHAQDPAPPAAARDAPEVEARYQQALGDFAAARFAEAAAGFEEVAARTVDPARRTTSVEMARQARARAGADVPIVPEPPEGTPVPGDSAAPAPAPGPGPIEPLVPPPAEAEAEVAPRSRDSRYVLLIGTTLLGLSVYGPAMAIVPDAEDKAGVGLYMIGAGASFFLPYLLTREHPVAWGMTDAWWFGGTRGALHGFMVASVADENLGDRGAWSAAALGSLAEGTIFTAWAAHTDASSALTNAMGKGSDFGLLLGLGLTSTVISDEELSDRGLALSGLLGAAAGYGAGWAYARQRDLTWGDSEVLRISGLLGAYAGAVPSILGEAEDERLIAGSMVAGGILGLVAGDHLLDGRDFSAGQGVVVELSTIAGGLVGAGLGYLVSPDESDAEEKIIAVGGVLGAAGGFALSYLGLETRAKRADGTHPPVSFHLAPDLAPGRKGIVLAGSF